MTDYELYHQMRIKGFTEHGAMQTIEVKNKYKDLFSNYDEYMGNFGFTEKEIISVMPLILDFIKEHNDYVLLYDDTEYENGAHWWLTTEY